MFPSLPGVRWSSFAATPSDIAAAIDRYYGNAEALRVAEQYTREKQEQAKARAALDPGSGNDENNVQQAPIVKLLGQIIEQAGPQESQRYPYRADGKPGADPVPCGWRAARSHAARHQPACRTDRKN